MSTPSEPPSGSGPDSGRADDTGARGWRGAYIAVLVWLAVQIAGLTWLSWYHP
jgi:hypothetical protein